MAWKYIDLESGVNPTLTYSGTVAQDDVVGISANETVSRGSAEGQIFGQVLTVNTATTKAVVKQGWIVATYTGTAPTAGAWKELVLNGTGGVKTPASAGTGTRVDIVAVDTGATTVTFIRC